MATGLIGGKIGGVSLPGGLANSVSLQGGAIPKGNVGLTTAQKWALYYLFKAAAYTDPDVANLFANFKTAFGITDPVNITGISINATASVEETLTTPLTITLSPANADEQYTATWASGDTSVATVSSAGVVTGVAEGSTTITCTVVTYSGNTFTASCALTVTEYTAEVTSITAVYTQSGTVYTTDSLDSLKDDLVVTAYYADSTSGVVASSAYTLSGTLTAGTSTITASYGGQTATFNVTVTDNSLLYSLSNQTFDGVDDYVDTEIQLASTDRSYTILVTATNGSSITTSAPIFHCVTETSPKYPGIALQRRNNPNTMYALGGFNSAQLGITGTTITSGDTNVFVIRHTAGDPYVYVDSATNGTVNSQVSQSNSGDFASSDKTLLIGCYQTSAGVKGRFWEGTISDFKIYSRVFSDAETSNYLGV